MKKIIKNLTGFGFMALMLFFFSACSDGAFENKILENWNLDTANLTVAKTGQVVKPGKSVTIERGEGIVLQWTVIVGSNISEILPGGEEVAAKDLGGGSPAPAEALSNLSVTITSEDLGVKYENLAPEGVKEVASVMQDAKFKLVAIYKDGEEELKLESEVNIIVTEGLTEPLTVSFTSPNPNIIKGEFAELCWSINRDDVTFSIVDPDGVSIYSSSSGAIIEDGAGEGDSDLESEEDLYPVEDEMGSATLMNMVMLAETVADADLEEVDAEKSSEDAVEDAQEEIYPPVVDMNNCISVTPTRTSSYQMNVYGASGVTASGPYEVTIMVVEALNVVFDVTPEQLTHTGEVVVTWNVTPVNAEVAVYGVKPDGETVTEVSGSEIVKVDQEKTFRLEASLGDQSVSEAKTVTMDKKIVNIEPIVNGETAKVTDGKVDAGTFFEGEDITIKPDIKVDGLEPENVTVTVNGESYAAGDVITVPATGEVTVTAEGEGIEPVSFVVRADVRKWVGQSDYSGKPVSSVTPMPGVIDRVKIGYRADLAKNGSLYVGDVRMVGDTVEIRDFDIPFQSKFESDGRAAGKWPPNAVQDINTYSINSIVYNPMDEGTLIAGVPAGIVYSDEGELWNALSMTMYVTRDKHYPGYHDGCKGHRMDGFKKIEIAGMQDICDIEFSEDGAMYVATSSLVTFLPNGVDAYTKDGKANGWKGFPTLGKRGEITYGTVNNDLEIVGGTIYSASSKGLLKSEDNGFHWSQVEGLTEKEYYVVKADKAKERLYLGTAEELYVCSLDATDCSVVSGVIGPIYDMAFDPVQIGTVYVATGNGLKVSRDGETNWIDITKGAMQGVTKVEAIAVSQVGDKVGIYVATDKGPFMSVAKVTPPVVVVGPDGEDTLPDDINDDTVDDSGDEYEPVPTLPEDEVVGEGEENEGTPEDGIPEEDEENPLEG